MVMRPLCPHNLWERSVAAESDFHHFQSEDTANSASETLSGTQTGPPSDR